MESRLFHGLNRPQKEAVAHIDGPLLVLAGPGSGKTRVVTHRIAHLIEEGIPPYSIAALTFTNKAAEEMRDRLSLLVPNARVWIGTFHSFCLWILHRWTEEAHLPPNFTIYDTEASRRLIEGIVDRRSLPSGCDVQKILAAISWAKNALVLPEDYRAGEASPTGKVVEEIYPKYQAALFRAGAVDFDDLLLRTALLLKNHEEVRARLDSRFRYILVDEYQDTNLVQYAIVRALSRDFPNLAVTGDPDQSIYGWRGANIRNILEFEKDFQQVKVVRLEENYRSTGAILAVASELIRHNRQRKEKELFTQGRRGEKPRILSCYNQQEEAEVIAAEIADEIASGRRTPGDYAVFFRMNALSRNLERALRQKGIPFLLVRGLEFFSRKEIKDILAYFQLIYNNDDTVSFERIVNLPPRGIGKTTIERIRAFAESRGLSLFAAAKRVGEIEGISARTRGSVGRFTELIDRLAATAVDSDMEILLSLLLQETKYLALFDSDSEEDKQRLANVQELLSDVREFDKMFDEEEAAAAADDVPFWDSQTQTSDRLGRFLEQAALTSDVDALDKSDRVSLMTLHAAKGLEFPVVYIVAVEENILPHERSKSEKRQLEEERRLLFVGITRAKEILRISRAEYREFRGSYMPTILSTFLHEITADPDLVDVCEADTVFRGIREAGGDSPREEQSRLLSDYLASSDEADDDEADEFTPLPRGAAPVGRKRPRRDPKILRTTEEGLTFEADEYCDQSPEETSEMVFDREGNLVPARRSKPTKPKPTPTMSIRTGADLAKSHTHAKSPGWRRVGGCCEAAPDGENSENAPSRSTVEPEPGDFLRHPDYGVGIVQNVFGPSFARVANVKFLTNIGAIDIPLDAENIFFHPGRKDKR
ncbi:MAG: UvrD-helicase domain-containing protein [Thermoguttaceae bacterium]|nr:UvrD-helicase domain-containing protein [Thermoguttaceae bacterium]